MNGSKFHQKPESALAPSSLSPSLANQSPGYFNSTSKIYPIQSTSLHFQSYYFILSDHDISPGIVPHPYDQHSWFSLTGSLYCSQSNFPCKKAYLIMPFLFLKNCLMSAHLLTWPTRPHKFWPLPTSPALSPTMLYHTHPYNIAFASFPCIWLATSHSRAFHICWSLCLYDFPSLTF